MIELLTSNLAGYVAAALVVAVAVAGTWLSGRKAGRDAVRREVAEAATQVAETRADADAAVARVADPVAELRKDWRRG